MRQLPLPPRGFDTCQRTKVQEDMTSAADGESTGPLDTTVVGCGAVAQLLYRKPLQRLSRAGLLRLVSFVDPSAERAGALAKYFGGRVAKDMESALATRPSPVVLVLSPAHLHCAHTLAAFERGCHVFCEKPLATTSADARRMTARGAEVRRLLGVGMIRRFIPSFAEMREIVTGGRLGELRSFSWSEGHRFDWAVTTTSAFKNRKDGGTGVLFDIGPHALDILQWIFGAPRVTSYADDGLEGVDSNVRMELQFPAVKGVLQLSWDTPLPNELRVIGSRGEAVLRVDQFDRLGLKEGGVWREVLSRQSYPGDAQREPGLRVSPRLHTESVFCQLIQFIRAIRLGEAPAVEGEAGATTVAVMEEALEKAQPLEMPWLSAEAQASFREKHWSRKR